MVFQGAAYAQLPRKAFWRTIGHCYETVTVEATCTEDGSIIATCACYAKLTDGSYVYTKLAGYSPITYATNQLKNSSNMQVKQLVASMLSYGAAAQTYFGYNTDKPADNAMTEEQMALAERYTEDMVSTV